MKEITSKKEDINKDDEYFILVVSQFLAKLIPSVFNIELSTNNVQ